MTWDVYGDELLSADLTATPTKYFAFKTPRPMIITGVRSYIVWFNNPTITNLAAAIYTDADQTGEHTPGAKLLDSTDSLITSEIVSTGDYALKEVYWSFDEFHTTAETWYLLALRGSGYTPSYGVNYLAWVRAWSRPVIFTGNTAIGNNAPQAPYQVYFYAAYYDQFKPAGLI